MVSYWSGCPLLMTSKDWLTPGWSLTSQGGPRLSRSGIMCLSIARCSAGSNKGLCSARSCLQCIVHPLGTRKHALSHHLYADDTWLYTSFDMDGVDGVVRRAEACIAEIAAWMRTNKLMLSDGGKQRLFSSPVGPSSCRLSSHHFSSEKWLLHHLPAARPALDQPGAFALSLAIGRCCYTRGQKVGRHLQQHYACAQAG